MRSISIRIAPLAIVASLLVLLVPTGSMGDAVTTFSGGAASVMLGFPQGGGNNNTSVVLPGDVDVSFATIDMEGRPVDAGSGNGFLDFNNPGGSTAWTGTTQVVPPVQAPQNYESTNSTADPGLLANNDANSLSNQANNAAAYQLFEFNAGGANLTNFTLYWKGMGTTTPKMGFSGSNIQLYIWNATATSWELFGSYQRPSMIASDREYWFNATGNSSHYIDNRGNIAMMATVSAATFSQSTMDTDYVSLDYFGVLRLWPENLTLDVGGDGSVEWTHVARLQGKTTFSGPQFASGLQRVIDRSGGPSVQIPMSIHSARGGTLYLSNLSILYDAKDRPPSLNKTIPDLYMDEDTNATLVDLRGYFADDNGVAALKFTIVCQQDPTKVSARMNPDGHRVDFSAGTKYWFGAQKFRVRATDARGQTVESNNFTVNVRVVNHPPVLEPASKLLATEGVLFEYTFSGSDPDKEFDSNESLTFSVNTTLLNINPSSGKVSFTPQDKDVGAHDLTVTVRDHYGANASMAVTLAVENVNDPPKLVYSVQNNQFAVLEDTAFNFKFNATDPDMDIGLDQLTFTDTSDIFNISPEGLINFTPDDRDIGVHKFRITVTDSDGLKDWGNFTMNIVGVDEPPVILPVGNITVNEDANVRFRINVTDEDANELLTFTSDFPLMRIDKEGWASFRADDGDIGTHIVTVTVRDRANIAVCATFTITINPVQEPPANVTICSPQNGTVFKAGAGIVLAGNATDEDGDHLNFTWYSDGIEMGSGPNISVASLKPGKHAIVLNVSDGQMTVASPPVNIEVAAKPAPKSGAKGVIPGFSAVVALAGIVAVFALCSGRRRD